MIIRSRFEGNEIILTGDKNDNATALVENIDFAFTIVGLSQIISGFVVEQLTVPDMLVKVSPGLAYQNTTTIKNLLYMEDEVTNLTISAADPTQTRIDIVEIRRDIVDYESESRQFKDPDTGAISTDTIDTKQEYTVEVRILDGTPGSSAPSVESGWLKIAEIVVGPAVTTILNANIKNVDGEKAGDTNTSWTTDTTVIYRNGTISDMKTFMVDLERVVGNDSDFADGLNNSDDGTYFGGAGKAVRDKYGILSNFTSGIGGGSGTTELEKVGKKLYDDLYTKSQDGGYAADELVSYKDTSGRIIKTSNKSLADTISSADATKVPSTQATENRYTQPSGSGFANDEIPLIADSDGRQIKTSNGKLSRMSDGYGGSDDNLFPSQDAIGSIADFVTGQGGTSGGSLTQQVGYNLRTTQTRLYDTISKDGKTRHCVRSGVVAVTTSSSYIQLFTIPQTVGSFEGIVKIKYSITSPYGPQFGSFSILITRSAYAFNEVKFVPGVVYNLIIGNEYILRVRYLYENGGSTNRGAVVVFEIKGLASENFTVTTDYEIISDSYLLNIYVPDTLALWDGNLPDGSSYATYGQASDDWWRFGAGETVLWSGSQVVAPGGSYSWTSPLFTGFTNQMFKSYRIYYDNLYESNYIDICGPRISSQIGLSPLYVLDSSNPTAGNWFWVSGIIRTDTYSDDFTFYSHSNSSITVYKIVGIA